MLKKDNFLLLHGFPMLFEYEVNSHLSYSNPQQLFFHGFRQEKRFYTFKWKTISRNHELIQQSHGYFVQK